MRGSAFWKRIEAEIYEFMRLMETWEGQWDRN